MHDAILLFRAFVFICAAVFLLYGLLSLLAGGMSDSPEAGDEATHVGALCATAGVMLAFIGFWVL